MFLFDTLSWPEDLRFFWFMCAVIVSFGFDFVWVLQPFHRSGMLHTIARFAGLLLILPKIVMLSIVLRKKYEQLVSDVTNENLPAYLKFKRDEGSVGGSVTPQRRVLD